jgi:soluble lytic murein transglycosylase
VLTADDYARRADILLYGQQGPAARELVELLPARPAGRRAGPHRLPPERLQRHIDVRQPGPQRCRPRPAWSSSAPPICAVAAWTASRCSSWQLPLAAPDRRGAAAVWKERRALVVSALKAGDSQAPTPPPPIRAWRRADAAEAEFYAGWIALTRLKQPDAAAATSPHRRHRRLADHQGPRALLARPRRRGARRPDRRPGLLCRGRALHHHLLRPVVGREGGPDRDQARPRSDHHPGRPRPLHGPRTGPRRADDGRHRGQATSSAALVLFIDDNLPNAEESPCWSTWRAAMATRTWPCAPCARRPSAASSCPSAAIPCSTTTSRRVRARPRRPSSIRSRVRRAISTPTPARASARAA